MIYNLSTNYNALFDLLLSGETLVGFVPYENSGYHDVCIIVRHGEFDTFIGVRGTGYGGLYRYMEKYGSEREVFIQHCANISLQWIQPCGAGEEGR